MDTSYSPSGKGKYSHLADEAGQYFWYDRSMARDQSAFVLSAGAQAFGMIGCMVDLK
jgi:hypothetical protein